MKSAHSGGSEPGEVRGIHTCVGGGGLPVGLVWIFVFFCFFCFFVFFFYQEKGKGFEKGMRNEARQVKARQDEARRGKDFNHQNDD